VSAKDDPRTWPVVRDEEGRRWLTLPSGVVQTYDEDVLAGMVVQAFEDVSEGRRVDERYLVTLRHLAGEEEWRTALRAFAALPEILAAMEPELHA
jgi:hypothetical protein